ncbi:ras and Rab interactor 3 [Engraulis encrasicolus]|uniref:ras and Rab interactor 3 n=1 Tax=Engraulis encrasicolus TaxID=184585 RepID=UPI002FD03308
MRMANGDSPHPCGGYFSLLLHLKACQEAWAPGPPWNKEGACAALWGRPAGSFLVLRDAAGQPELLCVCVKGAGESVKDFPICRSGTVVQLEQSHLAFPDIAQLVAFYTLTRDVLPMCLLVPSWISSLPSSSVKHQSQLGPMSWLCPPSESESSTSTVVPPSVVCTIQLTTTSGALCVVNPLYSHEHGRDWLSHAPISTQRASHPDNRKFERRLSTTRPWGGAGLRKNRGISLDEDTLGSYSEPSGGGGVGCVSPCTGGGGVGCVSPSAGGGGVGCVSPCAGGGGVGWVSPGSTVRLRRSSSSSSTSSSISDHHRLQRASTGNSSGLYSSAPQSPHRVSWVEGNLWTSPPPPPSLLQPTSVGELDSLSISSIEEESDSPSCSSPAISLHPRLLLADKVKNRLSAVGHALSGLVNPQKKLVHRVQELSRSKGGFFAEALRTFLEQTQQQAVVVEVEGRTSSTDILQEVRSSLTSLRDTLLDYSDVGSLLDSLVDLPDTDLDAMLEISLHKVALKPVCSHLYSCIHTSHSLDGSFQMLENNKSTLEGRSLEELEGRAGAGVPDPVTMEKIQQHWSSMHKAHSPNKKVQILLKVCKAIYHSMNANAKPGVVFGADDFLPCLTWVLLRSDVVTLQVDTDYMMELLDPMQLQGEGGYYLTSVYSALFYISTFRPRLAARQLSVEAQRSLSQWHRRRTLHCNQSRRGRHRRTIRRHTNPKTPPPIPKGAPEGGRKTELSGASEQDGPLQTAQNVAANSVLPTESEKNLNTQELELKGNTCLGGGSVQKESQGTVSESLGNVTGGKQMETNRCPLAVHVPKCGSEGSIGV